MAEKIVVDLKHPVTLADKTLKTLSLRRPTVQDLLDMVKAGNSYKVEDVAWLAVRLSDGLTPEDFGRLDAHDFKEVQKRLEPFLPD
ncbi:MAG: phage tail assembly protein [Deltaproteobacteria bacterium]|nr:phage tail assembly protein [Deltaproteobacteria bacterium]